MKRKYEARDDATAPQAHVLLLAPRSARRNQATLAAPGEEPSERLRRELAQGSSESRHEGMIE